MFIKKFKYTYKKYINSTLKLFNLRLSNYEKDNLSEIIFKNILDHFKIELVIDIGANTGQFAEMLLLNSYNKKIISVEPSYLAHSILKKKSINFQNWEIFPATAIGKNNTNVKFYETVNSQCSSTKKPKENLLKDYEIIKTYSISQITLSHFFKVNSLENQKSICLKLDTQGNELEILRSAGNTLKKIKILIVEISLDHDYEKQDSFFEIIDFLLEKDFEIWSVQKVYENINTGRTSYLDFVFKNKGI